jgi:uncharacterized protein (TIGR00369 family)
MEKIQSPYENLLEMYIVEKKEGFCKIGLLQREALTNPHGNFHGGVIASMVDTASVQSLRMIFPPGPYLTVSLEIRYKNASNSSEIFAEARAEHLRGKFFAIEVKVMDKEGKLLAEAKVKSFLPKWSESLLTNKEVA